MLTPLQFAQLAAAALPAAALAEAHVASHSQAGTFYTFYQAVYQLGVGSPVASSLLGCPFAALIDALEQVYCLNLVSPREYFRAVALVQRAEQAPAAYA